LFAQKQDSNTRAVMSSQFDSIQLSIIFENLVYNSS